MHQKRHGNSAFANYPNTFPAPTLWTTNSWQNPTIWPAVAADSDDKSNNLRLRSMVPL